VTWAQLGLEGAEYEIHATADAAELKVGSDRVDATLIRGASLVLYRRWRLSPPVPPVSLRLSGDPESFGEREWLSSVEYVLWLWRRLAPDVPWINSPEAPQNRMSLYHLAVQAGLSVPHTAIATRYSGLTDPTVGKAISIDERVSEGSYYPTTQLDEAMIEALNTQRSPCPTLTQKLIRPDPEIRVVYCLDEIAAIFQRRLRSTGPLDIRYDAEVERGPYELPTRVQACIRELARLTGLHLFTLDILVNEDTYWVVDITPSGTIGSSDDPSDTLFTTFSDAILRRLDASPLSIPAQSR